VSSPPHGFNLNVDSDTAAVFGNSSNKPTTPAIRTLVIAEDGQRPNHSHSVSYSDFDICYRLLFVVAATSIGVAVLVCSDRPEDLKM
jgi:hypothetical protein